MGTWSIISPLIVTSNWICVTIFQRFIWMVRFRIMRFRIQISIYYAITNMGHVLLLIYQGMVSQFIIIAPSDRTNRIRYWIITFNGIPNYPSASRPIIILSFKIINLIRGAVINYVFAAYSSATFRFPISVTRVNMHICFTATMISISAYLVASIHVNSNFCTTMMAKFPIVLWGGISGPNYSLQTMFDEKVNGSFRLFSVFYQRRFRCIHLIIYYRSQYFSISPSYCTKVSAR